MTDQIALREPPMLSVAEVAALLSISEGQVRLMIHDGRIAASKLDPDVAQSPWRIPRRSLDKWLGAWVNPANGHVHDQPASRPDAPREGGLSRESLRRRAGLDAEEHDGHRVTGIHTHHARLAIDAPQAFPPSGSVAPTHPEDGQPREPVIVVGSYRPPEIPHPSERHWPEDEPRPPRSHTTGFVAHPSAVKPPPEYVGKELEQPHDHSTWGAGPEPTGGER